MVVVTHEMRFARQAADRVVLLADGGIARADAAALQALLGGGTLVVAPQYAPMPDQVAALAAA